MTAVLTWAGKAKAMAPAAPVRPPILQSNGRPIVVDGGNWIIEGDNLPVLQALLPTYTNRIRMIYIDPPYNTGQQLMYNDRHSGRADWLNMMVPRLSVMQRLLREDGVIFISIGEDERAVLELVCDEIFGEGNALAPCIRVTKRTSNKGLYFSPAHDVILSYAKDSRRLPEFKDPMAQARPEYRGLFRYRDHNGAYNRVSLYMPSLDTRPNQRYWIECPDGSRVIPPEGKIFRWTEATFLEKKAAGYVDFIKTTRSPLLDDRGQHAGWNVYTKLYLDERLKAGLRPTTLLDDKRFTNSAASKELIKMGIRFPFSKPRALIQYLAETAGIQSGDVVADFFAGSGTTAHAMMGLNSEIEWILVQNGEPIPAQYRAGNPSDIETIADLCRYRVARASEVLAGARGYCCARIG